MSAPRLPALVRSLIGTWEGSGMGRYPTIRPFEYEERVMIAAPEGKPFLRYEQATWRPGSPGERMHAEIGYLRPGLDGRVEWIIAQPTGIAEILEGSVVDDGIRFHSTSIGVARAAKPVVRTTRILRPDGEELAYEMWMAAVDQEHQVHLEAVLRRSG